MLSLFISDHSNIIPEATATAAIQIATLQIFEMITAWNDLSKKKQTSVTQILVQRAANMNGEWDDSFLQPFSAYSCSCGFCEHLTDEKLFLLQDAVVVFS